MRSDQTTELLPGEPSGIKKGGITMFAISLQTLPGSICLKDEYGDNE